MKFKKMIKKLFLFLILSSFLAVGLEGAVIAQEVEANVHIKVEASVNSLEDIDAENPGNPSATWVNYSGTEYSGGETIVANPGDTIYIRTKIWNSSGFYAADNITGTSQTTNFEYVTPTPVYDDADGDTVPFTGNFYIGDGNWAISGAYAFGSEDDGIGSPYGTNSQGSLTSITLADSFPPGQTIITAQATITNYENREVVGGMLDKFGIAYAQGVDRSSMVRISVGEAAAGTPTITATPTSNVLGANSPTPTPTVIAAILPATGNDRRNNSGLAAGIASLIALTLIYGLFRTIKKSAHKKSL